MRRRIRSNKPRKTKEISVDSYGKQDKQNSFIRPDSLTVPQDCKYRRSGYSLASVVFMGRFKFGVKDQLIKVSKAFGVPTNTAYSNTTGILITDDINRTNSVTVDKARRDGILILSEQEFLYLINSNKKKVSISYEEI